MMPMNLMKRFLHWWNSPLFAGSYPRQVDEHTQEVAPGRYVLSCKLIESRWAPPGMTAVAWRNGQPCRWEPLPKEINSRQTEGRLSSVPINREPEEH